MLNNWTDLGVGEVTCGFLVATRSGSVVVSFSPAPPAPFLRFLDSDNRFFDELENISDATNKWVKALKFPLDLDVC